MQPIIIAIDGYSSCGKSTLAKALAKRLNYSYVDTGAMYRAVTLALLRSGEDWKNLSDKRIDHFLDNVHISFQFNSQLGFSETYLNGENVEEEIRGKEVSQLVSNISQLKVIRSRMVELQKKAGVDKALVMDGRDIGTVVFPTAELKLFMTADPEIRVQRRYDELLAKGKVVSREEVTENLKLRDYNDTHRKENPLKRAEDAVELDNSHLNQEEQLNNVIKLIEELVK